MKSLATLDQSNIAAGLQDFGIETDLTAEELFEVATQAFSTSLFMAVKGGMAFMAAQEGLRLRLSESGDGETFKDWIKKNKLTEQRVYEVIKIAKGYLAIPAAQRKSYLSLGKYKALKLASIEPEALAELAEENPQAIGEMALMSRSDMSKRMANLEAQLELEQGKNKRLTENQTKKRLTEFEPRTEEIRHECMALQLEAELPINGLQKLFEEVLNERDFNGTPESSLRVEQVWITANIVASAALDMLTKLGDMAASSSNGSDLPQRALGTHILTPEEAQNWLLSRPMIENRHEATKAQRKEAAEAAKPKGRGRPAGSKNKVGE